MKQKTIGTIAVAAILVAVLAMPVLAEAGMRRNALSRRGKAPILRTLESPAEGLAARRARRNIGSTETSGGVRANGQPAAQLKKRIVNVLAARKHRFDAITSNLNRRIDRIAALSAKVGAAGGDVSGVNAKLDDARAHLANALALEADTIAAFNEVPNATDRAGRRAAFVAARAKGRSAVAELKLTRVAIRQAAGMLRGVAEGLLSQNASDTVNAP